MSAPRKAFILAAGFGTRLRPLTLDTPKAMLPLWGRPMLDHVLRMLAGWGVREVLVNLHHAPDAVVRHLASHSHPDLRLSAVYEPQILGTGGALRNAAWFLDQPCWLMNADVVAHLDPRPLLRAWRQGNSLAVCWLTKDAGPRTVRCEHGIIRSFHDRQHGDATFCGLHLLDDRILRFLAPDGFDTIIAAYQRAQQARRRIAGVFIPGSFWADVGSPAHYVQAHRDTAMLLGHAGESFRLPAAAVLSPRERVLLQSSGLWPPIPPSSPPPAAAHPNDRATSPPPGLLVPVEVLPPRGSSREFFRIQISSPISGCFYKNRPVPAILIRWSPERRENRLYGRHTRFLASMGLPVPRLLMESPRDHVLLFEDLGADTLQSRLPGFPPGKILHMYRHLIDWTLRLHVEGLPAARQSRLPLMPGFNSALYRWEHDYFIEHMLCGRLRTPARQAALVSGELQSIARQLATSPQALIHRDWQSSNILFRDDQPVLIDYQGMRRGPAAYDLASLLCDPYADLAAPIQGKLLGYYVNQHPQGAAIASAFPAAAVQRLCQALGAYAALSSRSGLEHFARHIPAAARQLRRALESQSLPVLQGIARRLAES